MNPKLFELIKKYQDTSFFSWLLLKGFNKDVLINLPYECQIGVFLEYLYQDKHITISMKNNQVYLLYLNDNKEILCEYDTEKKFDNIIVVGYLYGIATAIKNNYLPF